MTWTLRERGDTGGTVRLEYVCPRHGRFELDVPRAESPDVVPCLMPIKDPAWGLWENSLCGEDADWSPGSITCRVKPGEVIQGKIAEYPGERHVMDTRPLADGMPLAEFKARRATVHRDIALGEIRKMTGRSR